MELSNQQTHEIKEWPKVAIIILNWNGWKDTVECLESLQHLTYPNYRVIVVDNGSTDGSVEHLRSKYPSLSLIANQKNLGYAGGNNIGIWYALENNADYVMILNNDTIVEPNAVTAMVEVARETKASVIGALIKDITGRKIVFAKSSYPAMLFYSESQCFVPEGKWWFSDRVEGSAMLLCRDFLMERKKCLGYFLDESLFLYCEEVELALWCRQNGKKSVVAGNAIVYHKVGTSLGEKAQPLRFYYLTRNRVIIARRYLSWPLRIVFSILFPSWRFIRSMLYFGKLQPRVGSAILKGLWDGYNKQRSGS